MGPRYIDLYREGELARRADRLEARLAACDLCPRACGVNRLDGEAGFCRSGNAAVVASACAHHGEEPVLSGGRGSGTIFFAQCNMRCLYCQNYQISQGFPEEKNSEIDPGHLARLMLYLQDDLGCHNINLVSPSHFVPQIVVALVAAVPLGLHVPLVYNTNGYDSVATLRELDGVIDIYLPDLRYASDAVARRLSHTDGYVERARAAIKEMYRQVGDLVVREGVAERGLIVRHLILPGGLAGSEASLAWISRELSPAVAVSVMSQYFPAYRARGMAVLGRTISAGEREAVVGILGRLGMGNGWVQEMSAAQTYVPDFERPGHPFAAEDASIAAAYP